VQKKYAISNKDTFNSLVQKNYQIAPVAMIEALNKLEQGEQHYISNPDEEATYNTVPGLKEAWKYRFGRRK
jgi:methionyl-tRNA formyltransferase